MRPSFFLHLHPPSIPAQQARWRYTLGAGGISVLLSGVVLLSGIFLTFYYSPSVESAAVSVQRITYLVPLGWIVRGLHFWSAQALLVFASVHLLRVVMTGAYPSRRFNYLLGLGLFVLILLLDFSGYVLRWDEGIHWALVVGTNLLKTIPLGGSYLYGFVVGAEQPSAPTLLRFYGWHLFGLMLPFIFLTGWHLFRLRRDGGLFVPPPALRREIARIKRFELVRREVFATLVVLSILLLWVAFFPVPIAAPILENSSLAGDTSAPWFFLWVQGLLRFGDPFWFGIVIPAAFLTLLALIPYILGEPHPDELGRWFPKSGRRAQILFLSLFALWLGLTITALRVK